MPFIPLKRSDAKLINSCFEKVLIFFSPNEGGLFSTLFCLNLNILIINSWLCLIIDNKKDAYNSEKIINILFACKMYSQLIPNQWHKHSPPNPPPPVSHSPLAQGLSQRLPHSCWQEECAEMMEERVTADNPFMDNKKCMSHFADHVGCYTHIRDSSYPRWISK